MKVISNYMLKYCTNYQVGILKMTITNTLIVSRYARFHLYTIETKFSEVHNFSFERKLFIPKVSWGVFYEDNNELIKGYKGASDLLDIVNDSAFIR